MSKEVVYKELFSNQSPLVDTLFKIYEKSKFNARVFYMNGESSTFNKTRLGVFDEPNGDFNIVYFIRKFGISKSNIIYSRESREHSIIKKGNKFYYKNKSNIKPLTVNHLKNTMLSDIIINEMVIRLPWFRYISEHNILGNVTLNTIFSKKLFSLEKALKHEYKLPLPSAKILFKLKSNNNQADYLKYYIEYLNNTENLHNTLPNYDFGLFYDTVKMAKTLGRVVNCSWSPKRLKEEHDAWSKEITDIIFTEGDRMMSIADIYLKFSDATGFKLLKTTKEMNIEGRKNNHCVATYVSRVENGGCGIYSIEDYTLELRSFWVNGKLTLNINQFRGYKNCDAPKELYNLVERELFKFNGFEVKRREIDVANLF